MENYSRENNLRENYSRENNLSENYSRENNLKDYGKCEESRYSGKSLSLKSSRK
jgi:hypothetical protein